MTNHLKTFVLLSAVTALGGCVESAMGGRLVREGVPTGTILVINDSNVTITAVTVSECNAMSHGLNRMSDGATIAPGQYYPFTVSAGCYDVQAGYGWGTGYAVADFNNISVPASGTYRLHVN